MSWVDRLQAELQARLIPEMSVSVTSLGDKTAAVEVRDDAGRTLMLECESPSGSPPLDVWVRQVASYYQRHIGLDVLR